MGRPAASFTSPPKRTKCGTAAVFELEVCWASPDGRHKATIMNSRARRFMKQPPMNFCWLDTERYPVPRRPAPLAESRSPVKRLLRYFRLYMQYIAEKRLTSFCELAHGRMMAV